MDVERPGTESELAEHGNQAKLAKQEARVEQVTRAEQRTSAEHCRANRVEDHQGRTEDHHGLAYRGEDDRRDRDLWNTETHKTDRVLMELELAKAH